MTQEKKKKRPIRSPLPSNIQSHPTASGESVIDPSIGVASINLSNACTSDSICNELPLPQVFSSVVSEWNLYENEEQLRALTIVYEHLRCKSAQQMLMLLTGVGGTGKSHVIHAIQALFDRTSHGDEILLSAPTGSATCMIGGYTIHALTFIGIKSSRKRIEELEEIWQNVKYLILDEVSMVSAEFLHQISEQIS
ncbi:hypothetical protein BKA83DRAFT_4047626, partial [Pisolithus microcarpus]